MSCSDMLPLDELVRSVPRPEGSWVAELNRPYEHLARTKGKSLRTLLIQAFNSAIGCNDELLAVVLQVVEILHTALLLIDDIEDSTAVRRGVATAHTVYGVPLTINLGNLMYFRALGLVRQLRQPVLATMSIEEMQNFHVGQGTELWWRDTECAPPLEAEYYAMVMNKTGGLFRLAVRLMCANSDAVADGVEQAVLVPLANLLGILYQVKDDYQNLTLAVPDSYLPEPGPSSVWCSDLTEGKFLFPLVHGVQVSSRREWLVRTLRLHPTSEAVKIEMVAELRRCGSFDYCQETLAGLQRQAEEMVRESGLGEGVQQVLLQVVARLARV